MEMAPSTSKTKLVSSPKNLAPPRRVLKSTTIIKQQSSKGVPVMAKDSKNQRTQSDEDEDESNSGEELSDEESDQQDRNGQEDQGDQLKQQDEDNEEQQQNDNTEEKPNIDNEPFWNKSRAVNIRITDEHQINMKSRRTTVQMEVDKKVSKKRQSLSPSSKTAELFQETTNKMIIIIIITDQGQIKKQQVRMARINPRRDYQKRYSR
ncbi:MAG: hypothetical protein EZS28_018437 [Streblomastix strix]|uniref:Uncharacterized protein n=1 Tax=Streblomastix strix TaxID=222440 RepID=A0A5J4VTU7_9EUKA|nr:MAG: hypothetical protein EZS28_018437 [Streblomastix strix]